MTEPNIDRPYTKAVIDQIPVIWLEPEQRRAGANFVLLINGFTGTKEEMLPRLRDLAARGFVAVAMDAWQHGERGTEERADLWKRVFSNFRRHMWSIIGNTTLDVLRVIDWAITELGVSNEIYMGGLSMGGDIAVAAAGIDKRISRVGAIVATSDWLRLGMREIDHPEVEIPTGTPDAYAQFFYDQLNPQTHLDHYAHAPAILFECAGDDTHVPPDGALRFQAEFRDRFPSKADRIKVNLVPNKGHMDAREPIFWQDCLDWFTR